MKISEAIPSIDVDETKVDEVEIDHEIPLDDVEIEPVKICEKCGAILP